jgi:hypothetical protein
MTRCIAILLTAAALAAGLALPAHAGSPLTITVGDNLYDPPAAQTLMEEEGIFYVWGPGGVGTANEHTVTQDKGLFKSGAPSTNDQLEILISAGKFPYHCKIHGDDMTGTVAVRPRLDNANPETGDAEVVWATAKETGNRFDVQARIDGENWLPYRSNEKHKSIQIFDFGPPGHSIEFRVRSKLSSNPSKRSGWSPPSEPLERAEP